LAAKIRECAGVEVQLIAGSGGAFDVRIDGQLVFSKHQTGRFPEDEEILGRLGG